MPTPLVEDVELRLDVEAYFEHEGNRSEAARARDLKRQTYNDRLAMAEKRLGVKIGKVVSGQVQTREVEARPLPSEGWTRRYICTSIQNNTHLHPGFKDLQALSNYWDDLDRRWQCEILVGTYSYNKSAYGRNAVKRGTATPDDFAREEWYAPEAEPYIVDQSVALAPGLMWCGEQNILPTNKNPLGDLEDYNGRLSNIVPHAKIAMESVASLPDEPTKLNYSTGTMTTRNYIQKRAGIVAEQHHSYAAVVVEVNHLGNWWVRQLEIGPDGSIQDLDVLVADGDITEGHRVEAVNWGDVHAAEMELWVREMAWGPGGMMDSLWPRYQFMHDVFSMRSRGHHEAKDFHRTYSKYVSGEDSVEDELQVTADLLADVARDGCETVVVPSNHDRHLSRWLNEEDPRRDPLNAKLFHLLQYQLLDAMDRGERDFSVLEWALRRAGCPTNVRFLAQDESFVVCRDSDGGVECGLHGDLGPNGSRGTTNSLTKLARRVNKGHDHKAAWRKNVCSAGACSLSFPYMKGPGSHSVTHIVTYPNGCRALVTMWNGQWRA